MARTTRSRKVDISEDHTALAIQTPLPDTPNKSAPLADVSVPEAINTMSDVGNAHTTVEAQVKHLKAAFREAIDGPKRGRKGKNKGKSKVQQNKQGDEENQDIKHAGESPVPVAHRQLLQSREGSLVSLLERLTVRDLTPTSEAAPEYGEQDLAAPTRSVRLTRSQLAKQQVEEAFAKSMQESDAVSMEIDPHDSCEETYITKEDQQHDSTKVLVAVRYPAQTVAQSPAKSNRSPVKSPMRSPVRSPAKTPVKTLEEIERASDVDCAATPVTDVIENEDDSFVEQITGRSPAKLVSRIEDSVEALDKLEDALEELQVALPERMISPRKPRNVESSSPKRPLDEKVDAAKDAVTKTSRRVPPAGQKPGFASMRVKSTVQKQPPALKKATPMTFKPVDSSKDRVKTQPAARAPVKRPASLLPPKRPAKSTKAPTRPTFELPGEAIARKLKEKREARLAQQGSSEQSFQTARVVSGAKVIKSDKPLTKPNFELPGEAVSRKKKEAQEARLKAQEEEERKRREFKAKPLRTSIKPDFVPRDTAASRARQSRIGLENVDDGRLSVAKRVSNVGAHRPSIQQLNLANTSAHRAPGPSESLTRKPSTGPAMRGIHMQRSVSDKDAQLQRQRAKEIYDRDARLTEDIEREKQEREAAAKRARAEAAERGRAASREWAEKQRLKKAASDARGLAAGYGTGTHMGSSE